MNELKAALKRDWETLSFSRGGSTITMQLAKNLYLNPSKNPLRKLREIVIARQLEQALSKRRIFELYLNLVEWGRNVYGAEAASRYYFAKSAADLDPLEAATLAALLPSPRNSKDRSILSRRNLILTRLASVGYLDNEDPDAYAAVRARSRRSQRSALRDWWRVRSRPCRGDDSGGVRSGHRHVDRESVDANRALPPGRRRDRRSTVRRRGL